MCLSKYLIWSSPEIRTLPLYKTTWSLLSAQLEETMNSLTVFEFSQPNFRVWRWQDFAQMWNHVIIFTRLCGLSFINVWISTGWNTTHANSILTYIFFPLPSNWTPLFFSLPTTFICSYLSSSFPFLPPPMKIIFEKIWKKVGTCTVIYKFHFVYLKDCVLYIFWKIYYCSIRGHLCKQILPTLFLPNKTLLL